MKNFESEVLDALSRLGTTPDEIAETLHVKGIKGYKGQAYSCPLANYFKSTFPEAHCVSVGSRICIDEQGLPHPSHVRAFIEYFDKGSFPQLEQDIV